MNRKIKFRGQRTDNGEWVYGYYVLNEEWGKCYIYQKEFHEPFYKLIQYEVLPESVGQFTGYSGKNNREIYEGDCVDIDGFIARIVWSDGGFCFEKSTGWLDEWNFADDVHRMIVITKESKDEER
jgi:hypothetical protein